MQRLKLVLLVMGSLAISVGSAGCARVELEHKPNDPVRIEIASVFYSAERLPIPCPELFTLPWAYHRTIVDRDTVLLLARLLDEAKSEPERYTGNDAAISVALFWNNGRQDTFCLTSHWMRLKDGWHRVDTAVLRGLSHTLPAEQRAGVDQFIELLRTFGP